MKLRKLLKHVNPDIRVETPYTEVMMVSELQGHNKYKYIKDKKVRKKGIVPCGGYGKTPWIYIPFWEIETI